VPTLILVTENKVLKVHTIMICQT